MSVGFQVFRQVRARWRDTASNYDSKTSHPLQLAYRCKLCPSSFKYRQNLTRHQRCAHGLGDCSLTFFCELCLVSFARRDVYRKHLLSKCHIARAGISELHGGQDADVGQEFVIM
ncbi:Zinc finger e-box-binding homeobox protein zag-1 [Plakobranchus ocellatus]|uniref:Zinc finger e-box-binding homeobox protein zag-1 n=1 Tax=Plakobranchus ocellatus TaxID=259542 RepID=A0AAV4B3R8_9GAST|nr:Zinc finger e-box-binding homeobox protein zag-1 [Plakobranchus ocellatus]